MSTETITLRNLNETLEAYPDTPIYIKLGFNRYKVTKDLMLMNNYILVEIDIDDIDNPPVKKKK